jgi:hypothetical protein
MTKDGDDLFGAALPPAPSAALRERVLSAARAEAPRTEGGLVDRIWESRGVRWGWALCVSALLLGHVAMSDRGGPNLRTSSAALSASPEAGSDEAAFSAGELHWLKPRVQERRLRVIDAMLDPTRAASVLGEEP